MTIRVLSFDFDGCLFNNDYYDSIDVIEANAAFLARIKEQNAAYRKVYTFVGSNRQSFHIDALNADRRDTESCFDEVEKVSEYLETTLDPFLMADVNGNLADGVSFGRSRDKNYQREHANWLFDQTKLTILYAQMHKIANQNPTEEIVFDFYDDCAHDTIKREGILKQLRDCYSKHPELIPSNVTLRLHHYAGRDVTPFADFKGTGIIDSNYRQTVKEMAVHATTKEANGIKGKLYVAKTLVVSSLKSRKALDLSASSSSSVMAPAQPASASSFSPLASLSQQESVASLTSTFMAYGLLTSTSSCNGEVPPIQPYGAASSFSLNRSMSSCSEEERGLPSLMTRTASPTAIPYATTTSALAIPLSVRSESLEAKAAKEKFFTALRLIHEKHLELQSKADALYARNRAEDKQSSRYNCYKDASDAAFSLHTTLTAAADNYLDEDITAFVTIANKAVIEARNSELKNHRGWKELLGLTALAVLAVASLATVGVAYVVAGSFNYAVNRQFFFSTTIKTDSINKIDGLGDAIAEIAATYAPAA